MGMSSRDRIVLRRDGAAAVLDVRAAAIAELVLDLTLSAPGIDWARPGAESAVVSIAVDGRYATDVLALSEEPVRRTVALGRVAPGDHTVTLRLAGDRSPPGAREAHVADPAPRLVALDSPAGTVLRHAPVLYGRTRRSLGSRFQNAVTDTPLLGRHERRAAERPGHERLEYSVVWSGEDGGTDPPASMAVWGRTTDIEWIYNLEVDAAGRRVGRTSTRIHGPRHVRLPFLGRYEDDHPLLQTWTANNNVLPALGGDMRFALGFEATTPPGRAREALMDANGWTYRVMAGELGREGRLEPVPDPATRAVGDPRTYLYVEVAKRTVPPNAGGPTVGLAVGVRLDGDPTLYRSDHGVPAWSLERDGAAATAVELPVGTRTEDVAELVGLRVPIGLPDTGATVTVADVHRAFLLSERYLPEPSFARGQGAVALTRDRPTATVWRRDP